MVRAGRPFPPRSIDELEIDPTAKQCIADLRACGFAIFVVTNQPDVARGTTTQSAVEAINARLATELAVDGIYTCFHDTADACNCRKPRPGLLFSAARDHGIDLTRSYIVGDRWSDIEAGRGARCRTVWIERNYDERQPEGQDARCASLTAACDWIIDDFNA